MKKQFFLLPLMALLLLLGCAKNEKAEATDTIGPAINDGETYIDDVLAIEVNLSDYTIDNSVVEFHQLGCDNGAYESLQNEDSGELSESRSSNAAHLPTCCSITDLSYTDFPSPRIHAKVNIGQAFEATNWLIKYELVENTNNVIVDMATIMEPAFPIPPCAQERNSTRPFNTYANSVGVDCPNDHTLYFTRYYEWQDSGILVECCTKSINLALPVDPNDDPC